jgi:AraC family transcriptional regulator, transcriptional activator of pobA
MKAVYPLHSIEKFTQSAAENGLYVSKLTDHLEKHECVKRPHKHDFYFVFLCIKGKGKQEIDFKTYEVKPGSAYFMTPGQLHRLINCEGGEGYILFHSRDYYEVGFNNRSLRDYPFYFCSHNVPFVQLDKQKQDEIELYFKELIREYNGNEPGRYQKTCSLIELIYISLSREYKRSYSSSHLMPGVPDKLQQFEQLLEKNLTKYKAPADYARMMKITTRQLNRICQETLGKSTSELIADRIILEAKRNLLHNNRNVAEVAGELGYFDTAYFTRLFRKKTGLTPTAFSKKYSSVMELV